MADTLDLARLEKLLAEQAWAADWPHNITPPSGPAQKLCCEAVRALPHLLSRISELESALRPFAEAVNFYDDCEEHPDGCPDDAQAGELVDLTVGDFRQARQALADPTPPHNMKERE